MPVPLSSVGHQPTRSRVVIISRGFSPSSALIQNDGICFGGGQEKVDDDPPRTQVEGLTYPN